MTAACTGSAWRLLVGAASAWLVAGCAGPSEVERLEPSGLCVAELERCVREDAPWEPIRSAREVNGRLPRDGARRTGRAVLRYPLDRAGGESVLVEGGINPRRVATDAGPRGILAAGVLRPHLLALPAGATMLFVEVSPGRDYAVWNFPVFAGLAGALADHVVRAIVAPTAIAVWAAVVGIFQLLASLDRRTRVGSLLGAGLSFAIVGRILVMQSAWTTWFREDSVLLARADAFVPLACWSAFAFYRWAAGRSLRTGRSRSLALIALAIVMVCLAVPLESQARPHLVTLVQIFTVVALVMLVAEAFAAHRHAPRNERWAIAVGVLALVGSAVADVVATMGTSTLFLGVGFVGVGLIVESMCQALVVAMKSRRAHDRVDELALELEGKNVELERVDRLKDAFLANTSHELRTPLNGILGLVETTLSGAVGALPSPVKRNLELVRASGRRLATLVDDILDFSKLREHAVTLRERAVALRPIVEFTMQTLAPLAAHKGLRLVNEVPERLGVRVDEDRVQQVLTNLVGNAIKFTHAGSVVVRAAERGSRIVVDVQDTGIGIAHEARERIFESFEQGDGSTAR